MTHDWRNWRGCGCGERGCLSSHRYGDQLNDYMAPLETAPLRAMPIGDAPSRSNDGWRAIGTIDHKTVSYDKTAALEDYRQRSEAFSSAMAGLGEAYITLSFTASKINRQLHVILFDLSTGRSARSLRRRRCKLRRKRRMRKKRR